MVKSKKKNIFPKNSSLTISELKGNGFILSMLADLFKQGITKWGKSRWDERNKQIAEKKRLEEKLKMKKERQTSGGKIDTRDIIDGIMGPWGWLAMGLRKKRERDIKKLKDQLAN